MKKLWQKNYQLNEIAEQYCSGCNVVLDNELIPYDVLGSMVHAKMLYRIKLITKKELQQLIIGLHEILSLTKAGKFTVKLGDEDVHTKIEGHLTHKIGRAGKKLNTGRSRNDQINVDLKLYTKDKLNDIFFTAKSVICSFYSFAVKYEMTAMPGYTHMQKAMPSSVGMWAGSFAESLLDDLEIVISAYKLNDQNPLGSGAAYGVSLPIDREYTTQLLGFGKLQNNSLYAQVSRCKSEYLVLHSLAQIMLTLSRFAQDMLLFTTSEFNFFTVDERLCTGSSIMPQKKNLDIMEILRARVQTVVQYENLTASILAGLPSGYNSDYAETKYGLMQGIKITLDSLNIVDILINSITPNISQLQQINSPEMYATHAAYELVKKGIPFRDAYVEIGNNIQNLPIYDPVETLKESNHQGGTGNLRLSSITDHLEKQTLWWNTQKKLFITANL